jgi:hypothetical protein
MIHVYGLCYRILDYAKKTVDNLRETASENFNLTCVEGKSCNSESFLSWGKQCLENKKIQRFITSSTNCRGYGLKWAIENFQPDDSEDFFILTDLDLLVPKNVDWIKEVREKMKKNVVSGFTLSNKNYVYPNIKWNENENISNKLFGVWLMSVNTKIFLNIYKKNNVNLIDSDIIRKMSKHGKRDIIDSKLYHLGWDSWKDDKNYWEDKKNKNNWNSRTDSNDTDKEPIFRVYTNDN